MDFTDNVSEIMKLYGVYDYEVQKLRSVYKIQSKGHTLILKRFNSKRKVINTKKIIDHLKNNDFKYLQNIFYSLENKSFVGMENKFYMCFDWINGREVNIRNHREIRKCIQAICHYHKAIKNIDYSSMELKDCSDLVKTLENDILNLYKIKDKILKKSSFGDLDKFYYENISRAIVNIDRIKKSIDSRECISFVNSNKILCHNSLYYQNFILSRDKVYLIDFGGICVNNRIYDLARFGRRIFYKNKFNPSVLDGFYKLCDGFYKFHRIEKLLFYSYLKYPYKFVKFGYKLYIKNENIESIRLMRKLKKYTRYELNVFEN